MSRQDRTHWYRHRSPASERECIECRRRRRQNYGDLLKPFATRHSELTGRWLRWKSEHFDTRYETAIAPNCCNMPNSSELPQRSTILPLLNFDICIPRIFIFLPVGETPKSGPVCVPVKV